MTFRGNAFFEEPILDTPPWYVVRPVTWMEYLKKPGMVGTLARSAAPASTPHLQLFELLAQSRLRYGHSRSYYFDYNLDSL